jgi:hypothetical protein
MPRSCQKKLNLRPSAKSADKNLPVQPVVMPLVL